MKIYVQWNSRDRFFGKFTNFIYQLRGKARENLKIQINEFRVLNYTIHNTESSDASL